MSGASSGIKLRFATLDAKVRRENPEYKQATQAISDKYAKELDTLRAGMEERYAESRKKNLPDYDIFMSIAEDIGYDATGKKTKTNELDAIGEALARFIQDAGGERI